MRSCRANGRTRAGSPAAHGWCGSSLQRRASTVPDSLLTLARARVPIDALSGLYRSLAHLPATRTCEVQSRMDRMERIRRGAGRALDVDDTEHQQEQDD